MNGVSRNLANLFDAESCKEIASLRMQIEDLKAANEAIVLEKERYQNLYYEEHKRVRGIGVKINGGNDIVCPEQQSALGQEADYLWKFEYHKLLKETRELRKEADELREHLQEQYHVTKEVNRLKEAVSCLSLQYETIKSERDEYCAKSANLDSIVRLDREAAEKRKELLAELIEASSELRQKQEEITQLHKNEVVGKRKHQEVIESLQSKLKELSKKCDLQNIRYDELSIEMQAVQKQASRSRSFASMTTSEVQTSPESGTSTPDSSITGAGVRLVNGESSKPTTTSSSSSKPRLGHHKTDSGLASLVGSSLDESTSSRRDHGTSTRPRQNLAHHPLAATVDRAAVDSSTQPSDHHQKLSVFVTRFAYIPAKHSPNEIHDQELELKKGEFVIAFGDMDEDGYYEGETLDGRRGFVPSNFVERLPADELGDFHASYPNNPAITSGSTGVPAISGSNVHHSVHFAPNLNSSGPRYGPDTRTDIQSMRPSDFCQKLPSSSSSRETSSEDPSVPPPSNLALEKQMHKSIMISWSAAIGAPPGFVESYNVYVDGSPKTSVRANERCRALVEGIDLSTCHRVSVRTCTGSGRESLDMLCTILVGKDCPVMPTQLRVTNISANSATVSWLPANSNYQHSIFVENREYAIVPASSHRFTIPDLSPSTVYRVRVVPIVPKSTLDYSSYLQACAQVEFKTLPDNVPDPPSTLQLESGPQDGTLLLTWAPVIAQRNCDVIGYAIYADGQKVQQIDSPTGDHALLDITRFQPPLPRSLTVRTISSKNLSRDSPYLSVTEDVLLGQVKAVAQAKSDQPYSQPQVPQSQSSQLQPGSSTIIPAQLPSMLIQGTNPSRQQNTVTFREPILRPVQQQQQQQITTSRNTPEFITVNPERDELSDILEEVEEEPMGNAMRPPYYDSYGRRVIPPRSVLRNTNQSFPRDMYEPDMMPSNRDLFGPGPGPRQMDYARGPGIPPMQTGFQPGYPPGFRNANQEFQPPMKAFGQMSIGPPPGPIGFQQGSPLAQNRYRPGPDPRIGDFNRRPLPTRADVYRGPYEDDYLSDRERERYPPNAGNHALQMRTSSLPQIEITKDDSFESMDSRNRAFSDREADADRGHRSATRGRYYSPPNDTTSHRRQRSQSRDRFDESPRRYRTDPNTFDREEYDDQRRPTRRGAESQMRHDGPRDGQSMSRNDRQFDSFERQKGQSERQSGSSGGTLERKEKMVRVFRALFDYDAINQSPNPDAASEELSFKEGQIVKILGDKDTDGFYKGEIHGRRGFVPCNMVSEVKDPATIRKVLGHEAVSERPRQSAMKEPKSSAMSSSHRNLGLGKGPVKKMIAVYDYDTKSASPNPDAELELSFKKGDVIFISGEMDDDGFFEGELNGRRGLVPSNFLRDASSASASNPSSRPKPDDRSTSNREESQGRSRNPTIREPNYEQQGSPRGSQQSQSRDSRNPNVGPQPPAPMRSSLQVSSTDAHGSTTSQSASGKR